ncbi:hypothetical protein BAE44_0023558, partial [Dichanthelium oligosanthes]
LTPKKLKRLMKWLITVMANSRQFKVLDWFLNGKDYEDGRFSQVVSNTLDTKLRDDLHRLKTEDQDRLNLNTIRPKRSDTSLQPQL